MLSLLLAGLLARPSAPALDALAHRLLGDRATQVSFEIRPAQGPDRFAVDGQFGKVLVRANNSSAACRGLYTYLKEGPPGKVGSVVNWDGTQLRIGKGWWNAHLEGSSKAHYRHYFNVCTFGYSTAFWNWKDWEREIDWMALHGLNFPLAMDGQEAVWQKVWRKHGLTDKEIRAFFTGPAFLPWHRMGNVNSHAGPLPQSWIDNQAFLQRRILRRMRELGITPVLPAFSGFLPLAFSAKNPGLKTRMSSGWCGFEATILLDPRDPTFTKIGKEFIDTYRSTYGVDGYYLADIFNEMSPRVGAGTKYDDLHNTAKSVYDAIRAGDPNGVWVTQGWLFYNESSFWGEKEIEAYLSGVPKNKIILLDLFSENTEIWRRSAAFRDRPYIWNMLHNFGGQTPLAGDLHNLTDKVFKMLDDPGKGSFIGMGLTMEGIHQNAPIYELMTDLMWSRPASADDWFEANLAKRWGSLTAAKELGEPLRRAFYSGRGGRTFLYQRRPTLGGIDEPSPIPEAAPLARRMLAHAELWANPLFRKDTLDVAKQAIGDAIDLALSNTSNDLTAGKPAPDEAKAFSLMAQIDSALDSHPHYRLADWVKSAEACVAPADRSLLAQNARLQITQWGGPVLSEYAAKEWAGLVYHYYAPRWKLAFDAMRDGEKDNEAFTRKVIQWEDGWIAHGADASSPPANLHRSLQNALDQAAQIKPHPEGDPGIAVGKPASDSGGTEQGGFPSNAVDGHVGGSWWSASPYPQWWQVDLGAPIRIDRVQVFTYYGDGRYYQYKVQVSEDGQNWKTVADMSANREASTRKGFEHKFAPVSARYVRVNMLFNSANIGVHLREVQVFAAK